MLLSRFRLGTVALCYFFSAVENCTLAYLEKMRERDGEREGERERAGKRGQERGGKSEREDGERARKWARESAREKEKKRERERVDECTKVEGRGRCTLVSAQNGFRRVCIARLCATARTSSNCTLTTWFVSLLPPPHVSDAWKATVAHESRTYLTRIIESLYACIRMAEALNSRRYRPHRDTYTAQTKGAGRGKRHYPSVFVRNLPKTTPCHPDTPPSSSPRTGNVCGV